MKYNELFETVTNRIIANLESTNAKDWQKPWGIATDGSVPHNASTGRPYSGFNFFNLSFESGKWGCNGWLTYKQAVALGGKVPSKNDPLGGCSYAYYCTTKVVKDKETKEEKTIWINKVYAIWNVKQIEGLEGLKEYTPPVAGSGLVNKMAEALDVDLSHGGDKACFIPSIDAVKMPCFEAFDSADHYDSTLLHELTHWTGHKSRLDRLKVCAGFGSDSYAFEELVAELGSAMGCAMLGIPYEGLQHDEYIKGWLSVLKSDVKHMAKASALANKAMTYLLDNSQILETEELEKVA